MSADAVPLVLHVVNTLEGGGTERALVALLHRFDRSTHRHAVVTLRDAGKLASELPPDVACRSIGASGPSRITALRLARIARRCRARIIHARNTGTWSDALIAGALCRGSQVVLGFHGLDHAGPFMRKTLRVARWAGRLGAAFTSVSESGRRRLIDELRLPPSRVAVLPNGVDSARFQPPTEEVRDSARTSLRLCADDFVVGMLGSLSAVKRIDLLIDAMASGEKNPVRARAVIVGGGPLQADLCDRAARAGLTDRIDFAGAQDDVRQFLSTLDAFVSCSDSEEMSNAILEAMACGIPIIATDVGDSARMLSEPRAGIIVPKGDAGAIAAAINQLASDPSHRERAGELARRRAVGYSLEQAALAYDAYYSAIASNTPCVSDDQPNQTASMVMSSLCGAAPTNAVTCLRT